MVLADGRVTPDSFQQRVVSRGGTGSAQADFDILAPDDTPFDLVENDGFAIPTDAGLISAPDVGGNSELALGIESVDDKPFTVTVLWVTESEETLFTQSPAALTETAAVFANFRIKSDRFVLTIEDTSGSPKNEIRGTVNIH
jgi:hypothetical protein